ncbi:MAG: hypothetical protein KGI50_05120 [Patescibacteria group bacterium]|nr:hypothetical protein [Patescibacteria group bacterium]MDE2438700.1 hypothetical protein [Patescibacteria group bacterium]
MINLQVDRRADKSTLVKSQQISPLPKFVEWNRPGMVQWPAVKAQGKLTLTNQPAAGQVITLGSKTYSFVASLTTNTDGQIVIGGTVAATRANIVAAVNLSGLPGSQYASATSLNGDVEAAIVGNDIIFTAKTGGVAGNSIVSTSTLVPPNTFDAATLGTYRAGAAISDAESMIIPGYRGCFNNYINNMWNNREMYYIGRSSWDGDTDRAFGIQEELFREFPDNEYLINAGATRKMYALNFLERKVKSVRTLTMYTKLRDIEVQTLSSPFAKSTSNLVFKTIELDATRFIVFYRQQAGTTGIYAVVGNTNTNGTVTWGAPLLMYTVDWYNENFDAVLINTDKVLIALPVGASNYINTAVVTISGTGIALNTPVQVINVAPSYKQLVKVGTDKAILAFENGSNINLYCVSVSGTVPSYGSLATIASASKPMFAPNSTDKCQIAYIGSGGWYSAVVTTSGSTITVQAGVQINYDTNYSYRYIMMFQITTDTFMFWSHWGTVQYQSRNRYRAGLITVSGTNTTLASSNYLPSGWWGDSLMYTKPIDATSFYFYRYEAQRVTGAKVMLSGTTLTFPNMPYKSFGWNENQGDQQIYKYQQYNNITQIADPVICNGILFIVTTDNNASGQIVIMSDKPFSFDLYNGDDFFGTFTKSDLGIQQKIQVDIPIGKEEFGLKMKSNDSVVRTAQIDHMYLAID